MSDKASMDSRHRLTGSLMAVAFIVAGYSQARVQIFQRGQVLKEADQYAHFDLEKLDYSKRGSVFSADGKVVAQSDDTFVLGLNYKRIPASPAFYVELSAATGIPATELNSRPENANGRKWKAPLTSNQANRVRQVRRTWNADGVSLERSLVRNYPMSQAMAGIVGAERSGKPISGIELSQDEVLAGTNGEYRGYVDRTGLFVADKNAPEIKKVNGQNIVLTVDSNLQAAAIQALRVGVQSNKAKSGCAIVIDPKTGDVLAMANWPTFDPDASWKPGEDFNMSYMGAYEPGSTFKILTVAKALDEKSISLSDRVTCNGEIRVGDRTLHCADHNGSRAHGTIDVEDAISKSCNVAAALWALKIGSTNMISFLDKLGLFEKPQVGLPFEVRGRFNRKDPGKKVQLATVGFGQSMGAVPIRLASCYAMLANKGMEMEPRLIKQIGDEVVPPKSRGQMILSETADEVMTMMESVIQSEHGTGKALKIPGYRLAGKTGTAQKIGTAKGKYVANFVGFVPAKEPKAVVLVMVDSPSAGKYYGGAVAGPIFVDIAKSVIRRFGIPPAPSGGR